MQTSIAASRLVKYSWYGVPMMAFFCAEAVNRLVLHQHMVMAPCGLYQLLDENALRDTLLKSMLLLHGQPPLFNLLAGLIFKAAAVLGCTPGAIAGFLFGASGLATAILLFYLTVRWTGSYLLGCIGVVLYFAEPSYFGGSNAGVGRNFFFYEFILQPIILLVIASADIWLKRANGWAGLLFVIMTAITVNTRTLFHPILWGIVITAAVLIPNVKKSTRATVLLACCALSLFFIWPIKNYILFGVLTSSSWDGYNLDRSYSVLPRGLQHFDINSPWPDATYLLNEFPRIAGWSTKSLKVVTAGAKSCGGPNWNNLLMLTTRKEALQLAFQARTNLRADWQHVILMYKYATRPMYIHPYTHQAFDAYPDQFTGYLWFYDRLFFSPVFTSTPRRDSLVWNVDGIFLLPLLFCSCLILIWVCKERRLLFGIATYTAFFPLISASLSDGIEGNRMRHSTYPLMILLALIAVSATYHSWIGRRHTVSRLSQKSPDKI